MENWTFVFRMFDMETSNPIVFCRIEWKTVLAFERAENFFF